MERVDQIEKKDCCGCSACESICAHHAITMCPDVLGFLYPKVDNEKCIDCGACVKVCAFHADYDTGLNMTVPEAYGVRHKDLHEVETSQSGAAFIAFSDWILKQGGVVYGAGYTDHFRVVHKRAATMEERAEFKGSKYVQSDMNTVFRQVKKDLQEGRIVLFSGTPCQTSGLASYIGKSLRSGLYLIDLICHGVPGPFVWRDYLRYLERKENLPLTSVNFRDKSKSGWHSHVESFRFADTSTYTYMFYTHMFYTHILLRYSCGVCPYTNLQRPSDVTIGDFWGVEKTGAAGLAADDKGCSLVLVNTEKGREWFDQVRGDLEYVPVRPEECLQPNLQHPSVLHPRRAAFERDYTEKGFMYVMKKYGDCGWRYYWLRRPWAQCKALVSKILPSPVKRMLKHMTGKK